MTARGGAVRGTVRRIAPLAMLAVLALFILLPLAQTFLLSFLATIVILGKQPISLQIEDHKRVDKRNKHL